MPKSAIAGYINPGELFVQRHGVPRELEDVLRYARWLRKEANIAAGACADLPTIYAHFSIPTPQRVPLPGQQGLLLNSDIGLVLINQDDSFMRQRFTEAHELMEFLFGAAAEDERWRCHSVIARRPVLKEQWCDKGAAELLMPRTSIKSRIQRAGVSFDTARRLANEFQVSLTAGLWQMITASDDRHAIVRWRMKHKPKESHVVSSADVQMTLFGRSADLLPQKRLRVEWSVGNSKSVFIPVHKSVAEDTAVYAAWRDGIFTTGVDILDLGKRVIHFRSENQPFEINTERQVISLITIIA